MAGTFFRPVGRRKAQGRFTAIRLLRDLDRQPSIKTERTSRIAAILSAALIRNEMPGLGDKDPHREMHRAIGVEAEAWYGGVRMVEL